MLRTAAMRASQFPASQFIIVATARVILPKRTRVFGRQATLARRLSDLVEELRLEILRHPVELLFLLPQLRIRDELASLS